MTLTTVFNTALSALNANQSAIAVTSNNVTNANTPGYARQVVQFSSLGGGLGISGVEIEDVQRVTDDFLSASARNAIGEQERAQIVFDVLDQAQSAYGDPTSGSSLFDELSRAFSSFGLLGTDPAAPGARTQTIADIQGVLDSIGQVDAALSGLRRDVNTQIGLSVTRVNELLAQIPPLNAQVQSSLASGGATNAEDDRAQVLNELAEYLDISVLGTNTGAVEVRTPDGVLLASTVSATLSYDGAAISTPGHSYSPVTVSYPGTPEAQLDRRLNGGRLDGLIELRDERLPDFSLQLAEFASGFAEAINAESNNNVAFPPPSTLSGNDTGLLGTDRLGFTGTTTISVLGADGTLNRSVGIDFTTGALTVNGAVSPTTFTANGAGSINEFITAANTALGGAAAMTLNNGVLTITAAGGDGVAFTDDANTPSSRAGRGFSEYFGLNNIITSSTPLNYNTGFQPTDAHGFSPGQTIELRLTTQNNAVLAEPTVTIAGTSFQDVLNSLNDNATGLGAYGAFALDDNGALSFTPNGTNTGARLFVLDDDTQRTGVAQNLTNLFGLGETPRVTRASSLTVNPDMTANTTTIPLGRLDPADPNYAVGEIVTGRGDAAGAQALQAAETTPRSFGQAGGLSALTTTISDYGARVLADAGAQASTAERALSTATRFSEETAARRASVEGVNVDEELLKLTQYQQGYQAASRLIQVTQDMLDTLLSIV